MSERLEATGERLMPEQQHGELVHAEHLARYRLAAQLAPGRRVLDVACGEGYGAALLAAAGASSVVGVDLDEATVEHARARHGIEARVGDVRSLPFEDGAFDLVVSFETIEHVEEPERALDELARVVAADGLVVVSTPNASQYLVENEFHVREFGHAEFVALLEGRFPAVRLLFQHNWLTSAVVDEAALRERSGEGPVALELTKVRGVEPGDELYLVAVCGGAPDQKLCAVGVMAGVDEAHALAARLVEAEATAHKWHDAFQEALANSRWMSSTLSWRLTKPFRLPGRLLRRRR
jgi:2-polyprenyl-3-methyl-5-hydroxy-6-metoxy-1,4-benzoquinol methylase